jgi:hypothetical protein
MKSENVTFGRAQQIHARNKLLNLPKKPLEKVGEQVADKLDWWSKLNKK